MLDKINETHSFHKSDFKKGLEDFQILIDIALAIIVCLGEGGVIQPKLLGSVVIGLAASKAIVGIIIFIKDDSEKKEKNAEILSIIHAISLIALFVLSALLIRGHLDPKTFAIAALGIDLGSMAIHLIAKRACGKLKNRYSCCV